MTPVNRLAQVVTSSAISLYSLTFLRRYISNYDSPLKRCLKDTFLLPLLTCVFSKFHNLKNAFFPFGFDSKQHRLHPRPPCLILIPKTFIDLCFVFKQLASLRKLIETCDEILTSSNKSQASASHQKLKTCDDLRSRLIRA